MWFWSNHFCMSADKIVAMAGAYEREAIRPHVLGRFADMLTAVESHPAMLFYLDNVESMGPNSIAGINRDKGLNENLAREILELHTLGVRSGYTQADVTSFAKVLTGWTWIPPGRADHGGEFIFIKRLHEPGAQTVLGKRYPDTGVEQGRAVLADLARHPATARHIAQKLARHFVADEPPPALVAKLEKTFSDTDGDLKEVAKTLVAAENRGRRSAPSSNLPRNGSSACCASTGAQQIDPDRPHHGRAGHARRAAVAAAGAERLFRCRSGVDRRRAAPARHRQRIRRPAAADDSIRWPCSTAGSVRSPRPKRATRSRAPKAALKRWRCW